MPHQDKFEGFADPTENWSKLPHQLIDALPIIKTVSEVKVILYILRHTWGFHETEKRISLDEFAHGRKRKGKPRMDGGTGLSVPSIRAGIHEAIKDGFILVETDSRDKGRVKKFYSLAAKDLHAGYKSLSPRVQKSFNRTKKETIERNPNGKKGTPSGRKRKPLFQGKFADLVRGDANK